MSWNTVLALVCVVGMVAGSLYLRGHVPATAQLPMQWGLNGRPTWYAPRDLAVALIPLVALAVLAAFWLSVQSAHKPLSWAFTLTAAAFFAVHATWLYFASRSV